MQTQDSNLLNRKNFNIILDAFCNTDRFLSQFRIGRNKWGYKFFIRFQEILSKLRRLLIFIQVAGQYCILYVISIPKVLLLTKALLDITKCAVLALLSHTSIFCVSMYNFLRLNNLLFYIYKPRDPEYSGKYCYIQGVIRNITHWI